jgi:Flp pilus assembly protein protease CpaA
MKTTTLCIVVCVSLAVLVVAILLKKPAKKQTKEGFEVPANAKEIGIGIAIALAILLLVFGGFFMFFYSTPKQPNVVVNVRRGPFLNNLY